MGMNRYWAIYDVFLGNPVLVERCATKEGAMRFVEERGLRSCGALFIVEQLLPAGPRLLPKPADGQVDYGRGEAGAP
jgi:hypothetical protein